MPYYARSAYFPLPSAPQTAAQPPQPQQQQQQQQYAAPVAPIDQVYLRQQAQAQAQAQQIAYQQQQQAQQQQQYAEQQNRQLAQQQQYYQQQQQYAAQQQQRLQQQQYQQQQSTPSRQQQRSGYQAAPIVQQSGAPLYKSSEYVHAGGVYSTGGAFNQPSLRRVNSRADVNTAIENQEAPFQSFGQGLNQPVSQYNPYATYGQTIAQSSIIPASQCDNAEFSSLPPRSPARGYSTPQGYGTAQRGGGYGSGQQAESAYISIPNDLVYAQNDQQRACTYAQESRPVFHSSSRTNQIAPSPLKLKPAAARELYAALSSDNVRTALERDSHVIAQAPPTYADYNGQRVQGRAFLVPANQKYSEYNQDDLNNLSVIDR